MSTETPIPTDDATRLQKAHQIARQAHPDLPEDDEQLAVATAKAYQSMGGSTEKAHGWLLGRIFRRLFAKGEDVKEPGSRGGRYFYNEKGHLQYGERPASGHEHVPTGRPHIIATEHVGATPYHVAIMPHRVDGEKTGKFTVQARGVTRDTTWLPRTGRVHRTYDDAAKDYGRVSVGWLRHGRSGDRVEMHDPVADAAHNAESLREVSRVAAGRPRLPLTSHKADDEKPDNGEGVKSLLTITPWGQILVKAHTPADRAALARAYRGAARLLRGHLPAPNDTIDADTTLPARKPQAA